MDDDVPNNYGMALGRLEGTVNGVQQMLNQQNIDSAKYRSEQATREVQSRQEFMDVFKGMRDDNKEQTRILQETQKTLVGLVTWQTEVHPKIKVLWDKSNNQNGFLAALTALGGIIGGGIVAAVEYFKR